MYIKEPRHAPLIPNLSDIYPPFFSLLFTTVDGLTHSFTHSSPHQIDFFVQYIFKQILLNNQPRVVTARTSASPNFSIRFLKLTQYDTCRDF
jgi:hypothetical protein